MAFNSHSYHRNKAKRSALAELEKARDIKRRAMLGTAYDWEIDGIPRRVEMARINWRLYLSYLEGDRMDADIKKTRTGEMSHEAFMAKWRLGQ
jgi:hypothetical protein